MSWHLKCNDRVFFDKIEAIREHKRSKAPLVFKAPKSFYDHDFSVEPKETLEQLCITRAKKIRDTHGKVVLFYSGGCDSHYILETFINNNIKIDELILVKSGFKKADFEIDQYALPFAERTGIKVTVRCPNVDYYEKFYIKAQPMLGTANNYWHHFRLNNHFENLTHYPTEDTAYLFGKEKPKMYFINEKWYTYFLDVDVTPQPYQINFYCDDPRIHSKQCHMLVKQTEAHRTKTEYNRVTGFGEFQHFWNLSIGRYKTNNFPVKEMEVKGNFNNKDGYALGQASPRLIEAWRNRNQELATNIGSDWFNQRDPAIGTIGVFSEFFGITDNKTKTVDELFPNGFKIQ